MNNTAAARIAQPYGIRLATARSTEPVRRYITQAAAEAAALRISQGQGGAAWIVSGPQGTRTVRYVRPGRAVR
jgi:hypothetical protein